jgi:antibiotic biosynthesis monooxygenase (ABM) superfamily enzyme
VSETLRIPVTVSATRRPLPGHREQLHAWAAELGAEASRVPGHLDSQVERHDDGAVTIALVFDSAATLAVWEASASRARCLAAADPLTDGEPAPVTIGRTQSSGAPPRWRTAVVVWAGLFPFSLLFTATAGPMVTTLPVPAQSLVTSTVLVPLAVYVGIPLVNAMIRRCGR